MKRKINYNDKTKNNKKVKKIKKDDNSEEDNLTEDDLAENSVLNITDLSEITIVIGDKKFLNCSDEKRKEKKKKIKDEILKTKCNLILCIDNELNDWVSKICKKFKIELCIVNEDDIEKNMSEHKNKIKCIIVCHNFIHKSTTTKRLASLAFSDLSIPCVHIKDLLDSK